MYTNTRAALPNIEQLRAVRRWSWRLLLAFLLAHYVTGVAHGLLQSEPELVLIKVS